MRAYCMRDVCYAGMQVCVYVWVQVWYALCNVRYAGRAGGTECWYVVCATQLHTGNRGKSGSNGSNGKYGQKTGKMMKNGLIKPIFGGIVDILYDGFRKCFVNCKFTFYITLSSYYKKVKISKTSKNHSKM